LNQAVVNAPFPPGNLPRLRNLGISESRKKKISSPSPAHEAVFGASARHLPLGAARWDRAAVFDQWPHVGSFRKTE